MTHSMRPGVPEIADVVDKVHRQLLEVPSDRIDSRITELLTAEAPLATPSEVDRLHAAIRARTDGLGPLEPFLADGGISDIMVNGDGRVWVERHGAVEATGVEVAPDVVRVLLERVLAPIGRRADRSSPIVDARLVDGSRLHAVLPPLALDGPILTIRRFRSAAVTLADFASSAVVEVLVEAVCSRRNIVVSGGTGAGKTTLLAALLAHVEPHARIVTIEDAAELCLTGAHVVRLEARPANAEGGGAVTIRDLVRAALRMRPDRIVVGEVRGAEALDMALAMNTGHAGCMSTCHANGPADALHRLETLAMFDGGVIPIEAVREQLRRAVDLVVHVARGVDGARRVVDVAEVSLDGVCSVLRAT